MTGAVPLDVKEGMRDFVSAKSLIPGSSCGGGGGGGVSVLRVVVHR